MAVVEKRVDNLEKVLAEYITTVGNAQRQTEKEMREFKDEMCEFKDEMREFKDEMLEFKDEMCEFKKEASRETRRMNEQWGNIANKMGTLVEDLVAPSIPRIIMENFNQEVTDMMIRRKRKLAKGRIKEYDAIAVADDCVYVNATKSTLRSKDVEDFLEDIKQFREYFQEYESCKIIGILASLYVDVSTVKYAEKYGFMVLAVGDELMEVKNNKGFQPKLW
jgi:chromosome segregation ATPase